jgi:endonuclease/exonuclease/phosphatase family metal-dependent hydrolase
MTLKGLHVERRREPRAGRRLTLAATVNTPAGPLQLYSAHLEVFCGPLGRLRQFADILTHSRAAAARGVTRQVLGGDLNTMGHGVARFSPFHCTDRLRWASLGQDEAHWWQRHVFDVHEGHEEVVEVCSCTRGGVSADARCIVQPRLRLGAAAPHLTTGC